MGWVRHVRLRAQHAAGAAFFAAIYIVFWQAAHVCTGAAESNSSPGELFVMTGFALFALGFAAGLWSRADDDK